jgi:hypothetical protein
MTRKILPLPAQERLRELFEYDSITGSLTWRIAQGTQRKGAVAGWQHKTGYQYVGVDKRNYKLHRVVWMWVYGADPADLLDHKDRDKTNNRIQNLREATHAQNQQNKKTYANNISGHKGVSWYPLRNKWRVRIQHNKAPILLGFFDTLEQAIAARKAAEGQMHTHAKI